MMNKTLRRHLIRRLAAAAGITVMPLTACSTTTVDEPLPNGTRTSRETVCYPLDEIGIPAGDGGSGGIAQGGSGGTAQGGSGRGLGGQTPLELRCPTVEERSGPNVVGGPERVDDACCYVHEITYVVGRPYQHEGRALCARPRRREDWAQANPPCLGLDKRERTELAQAWARDALYEHASVASFARCSLELMAFGAPSELLEASHRAALDEVRHARACFALASRFGGAPMGPDKFPLGQAIPVCPNLATFAARVVEEGCIGETVATVLARHQLAVATDHQVREALQQIAEEEAEHAELAWRTVAWALSHGGSPVRAAVTETFARLLAEDGELPPRTPDARRQAYGRLDVGTQAHLRRETLRDIISPCADALVNAHASS